LSSQAVRAESAATGSIHASGQQEVKLAPKKLRMTLNIRAEGADAKSAIEAFVKHKERVKKELLEMKADEASIEIGAPQLSTNIPGMPDQWSSYAPRIYAQTQRAAGVHDASQPPKVYVAVSVVKAEWPLPTTDADALALLPETLKEQITSRDLVGQKNKAKLDKAQQEKIDELKAAMQENYAGSTEETQQFTVLFVADVDEQSRKQALKTAYDRAVAQAETLASVSGHKLGDLVSLRCDDSHLPSPEDGAAAYAAMAGIYPGVRSFEPPTTGAQSTSPSGLKFNTKVDVEFAIAK
jgi:uncharacterized protein YggE